MAISTSYSLTKISDLPATTHDGPHELAPFSGGFISVAGDKYLQLFPTVATVEGVRIQTFGADGAAGVSGLISGAANPSVSQLLSPFLVLGQGPRFVTAYEAGDEVKFRIYEVRDGALTTVRGETGIGTLGASDAETSAPVVLALQSVFSGGLGSAQAGGFAIASIDVARLSGVKIGETVQIDFFSNSGVHLRSVNPSPIFSTNSGVQIAQLDNGNVAVAWTQKVDAKTQVMYAIYNRDGTTVVKAATILDNVGDQNRDVAIVATDHGFAVAYEEVSGGGLSLTQRGIKMASVDASGNILGSKTIVSSSSLSGAIYDGVDLARLPDGQLAVSYAVRSGIAIIGQPLNYDVVVALTSQSHSATAVTQAANVTGGAALNDDATGATLTAYGNGRLAALYANGARDGGNGETLQLLKTLTGDGANDVFTGTAVAEAFVGGAGTDTVSYAGAGAVTASLKSGTGTAGWAAGDTYNGIENLTGGNGADNLTGSDGVNVLNGGAGADTLDGQGGNDTLLGGTGNDTLYGRAGADMLRGQDGDDFLFGGNGNDRILGGNGHDRLNGDGGNDILRGETGRDFLFGGAGRDTLFGGIGDDNLDGGQGNDRLLGEGGNDMLRGGQGNDALYGGAAHDVLYGGIGNDRLFGGNGIDLLDGGAGADTLTGGAGSDTFVFGKGYGRDVVTDFQNGTDRIYLTGGLTYDDVNLTSVAGGVRLTFDGQPASLSLTLQGMRLNQIDISDFTDIAII